jgi:hypothetical protein
MEYDETAPYVRPPKYENKKKKFIISYGVTASTKGRYKEKFHFNERMAQWNIEDPPIPVSDMERILHEAIYGEYGPLGDFTRATIITITRKIGLTKYRERWKTLLNQFTQGNLETPPPDAELKEWCFDMFDRLVSIFPHYRGDMAAQGGKSRHNFISYNYVQRKLLEAKGIWIFHPEFPIPRSHVKIHNLDNVFERMAHELDLPFTRTCVIKRPKLRKRKK